MLEMPLAEQGSVIALLPWELVGLSLESGPSSAPAESPTDRSPQAPAQLWPFPLFCSRTPVRPRSG